MAHCRSRHRENRCCLAKLEANRFRIGSLGIQEEVLGIPWSALAQHHHLDSRTEAALLSQKVLECSTDS